MRNQLKQPVQPVRFAGASCRPLTPQQPPWKGPLPPGAAAIFTRDALAERLRNTYAPWTTSFVMLEAHFVQHLNRHTMRGAWKYDQHLECANFPLEDHIFWVQKQLEGWTIELCHPDDRHPDTRILALEHIPVLCRDGLSAAELAQTCFGKTPAGLLWLPFW
ncbi:hypothetical protein [Bradyrhizobium brasilense]|uniref:hypothetical protein n=1 Tax=Bradyrhizobium brasilense TaxID=1419277 RepID=UPI0011786805|nr:hypothetical protein [Bradyrhizobium brasilense]